MSKIEIPAMRITRNYQPETKRYSTVGVTAAGAQLNIMTERNYTGKREFFAVNRREFTAAVLREGVYVPELAASGITLAQFEKLLAILETVGDTS